MGRTLTSEQRTDGTTYPFIYAYNLSGKRKNGVRPAKLRLFSKERMEKEWCLACFIAGLFWERADRRFWHIVRASAVVGPQPLRYSDTFL